MEALGAIGFALFLWWFGTGAVLLAVRRTVSPGGQGATAPMLAATVGVAALLAFHRAGQGAGVWDAVLGFAAAVAIWGWHEYAFMAGWLTGPNRRPCPPGATGARRFWAAFWTLAWHHFGLVATVVILVALSEGAAQKIGLWTFLVLYAARVSAQLNVYLGVPNMTQDFVPAPLSHLTSYFRNRAMNGLFPVSVTALTFAAACFAERAVAAPDPGTMVGFTLLASLTALALIEHWFLVLPIRDALLWRWLLPETGLETGLERPLDPDRSTEPAARAG